MPSLNVQVALSEVLEVRAGPLTEREMWAVLSQATEALQHHFMKGEASHNEGPSFAVTLDTMLLNGDGFIQFTETSFDSLRNKDYMPPEWNPREYFSDEQIEKIYIFAMGVTIYNAADHNLGKDDELDISDDLDLLLGAMCEDNVSMRVNFLGLLEACQHNARQHAYPLSNAATIQNLYRLVLGSGSMVGDISQLEVRDYEQRVQRSRSPKHNKSHDNSRLSESSSRQRSRSRSKPRSRSRSGDRSSRFSSRQERPVPVGRDQTPEQRDIYLRHSLPYVMGGPPGLPPPSPYHHPHHHPGFVPPPYGSGVSPYGFDPYYGGMFAGRKIVGEDYRGMYGPPPPAWGSASPGLPMHDQVPAGIAGDPNTRKAYERIKERQQKLSLLKRGMEGDDYSDSTSMASEQTDLGDRRSVISANSYTQGMYRPDLLARYGPERALRMGRESEADQDENLHGDAAWIRQQEQEIQAMQRALENFLEKSSSQADLRARSRQRSRTPGPSRPMERPSSRQRASSEPRARSKSREARRLANRQPRKCYGPEFIQTDKVTSAHVPQAKSTNVKDVRHVFVHLLNGEKLDMTCETSTLGRDLFDAVVAHLGLVEHYLFGLSYAQEAETYFIDPDQKLSKVAPAAWKDPGKHRQPPPFTTYFRVKFYVENAAVLKHPTTKHLFYLQLRRDLLEDKVQCTEEQAMTLGGLAMQAEYGDWYEKTRDLIPEVYLPPRVIKQLGKTHARDNLPLEHRKHRGMQDTLAEMRFVRLVQQLDDYGIHYYKVYRSKKDTKTQNCILTGISVQGILTAEQEGNTKVVTRRHPWQLTQKISFNRRRFSIKPKAEMGLGKSAKLDYYTDSYKKGRYLLKLATAHHRFMITMRMRVEPNLANMIEEEYDWNEGGSDYDDEEDDDVISDVQQYEHDVIDDVTAHPRHSYAEYSEGEEDAENPYDRVPPGSSSRFTSKESLASRSRRSPARQSGSRSGSRQESRSDSRSPSFQGSRPSSRGAVEPKARVIGVSVRSRDSGFLPLSSGTISDTLRDRFESMEAAPGAPERRIVIVDLQKEPQHGIGLSIVGGQNTGKLDLGVFVKELVPGGPADRSGQVRPGDRIIAINGQSLEGIAHAGAVQLIRESRHRVQLLLSQAVTDLGDDMLDTASDISQSEATAVDTHRPVPTKGQLNLSGTTSARATTGSHTSLNAPTTPPTTTSTTATTAPFSKPARTKKPIGASQESLNVSHMSSTPKKQAANSTTSAFVSARVQRTESMESSDLDIENVIPPEAMSPLTIGDVTGHSSRDVTQDYLTMLPAVDRRSPEDRHTVQSAEPIRSQHDSECEDFPSSSHSSSANQNSADVEPGEEYTIRLHKIDNSLGLNIAGGVNTTVKDGGIYVKSCAEGGSAQRDGRIQVGDRLLSINGVSLRGVTHKQAVETLRSAPVTSQLLLVRATPPSARLPASPAHNRKQAPGLVSPSVQSETTAMPDTDIRSDTEVTSDFPASPVDDVINTASDESQDPYAFVNSENVFKITLIANEALLTNNSGENSEKGNTYEVDVARSSYGLGFSVLGGIDKHSDPRLCIVRVKKVFPHGPAYAAGLQEGDVLLQVNNHTLGHLANKEVLQILRTATPEARLLICRPGPGVLPPISQIKQDLDCTLDSQASFPMATSTPTADQILNDPDPGQIMSPCSPIANMDSLTPIPNDSSITPTPNNAQNNLHKPLERSHTKGIELDPKTDEDEDSGSEVKSESDESDLDALVQRTLTPGVDGDRKSTSENQQNVSLKSKSNTSITSNTKANGSMQNASHLSSMNKNRSVIKNQESDNESDLDDNEIEDDSLNSRTESQQISHQSNNMTSSSRHTLPTPVKHFLQDAGLTSGDVTPTATPSIDCDVKRARDDVISETSSMRGTESTAEVSSGHITPTETNTQTPTYSHTESHTVDGQRSETRTQDGQSGTGGDTARSEEDTERDVMAHEFEVTLTKGEKGLGFTVAGGQQAIGLFYVKDVLYNPALSDGRIHPGDRLIGVNGEDMTNKSHREAVDYLRQTPQTVTLCFLRVDDWDTSEGTSMTSHRKRETDDESRMTDDGRLRRNAQSVIESLDTSRDTKHATRTHENPAMASSTDKHEVVNQEKTPLHSKLSKQTSSALKDNFQPPEVEIDEAEVSEDEEESEDDTETATLGKDPEKLNATGHDDPDQPSVASSFGNITLPMSDIDQLPPAKQPHKPPQSDVIRIDLRKPLEGGLGFTLVQGEKGPTSALFVRSISPEGAASSDGRLKVGDKLLQVNGESVIGMPHNKAVALIKKSGGLVQIAVSRAISRPPSTIPTPAATPSRELEDRATPVNDLAAEDTDSDVDSCTLDDSLAGGTPKATRKTVNPLDASHDASLGWPASTHNSTHNTTRDTEDEELQDTFDEGSDAYNAFLENKGGVKRQGSASSYQPSKPEESKKTRFDRVPARLTSEFVTSLDLVTPPRDTVHYTGRQLTSTCKALRVKVERDDPVEEYKALKHAKLTDNCLEARKPENKPKNRFRNVIPYDANRVVLQGQDDYINASHVQYQVGKEQLHYIATQGPMPETTGDFWRMVWEQRVQVVAMVTQDTEGGKVKCHRYWPDRQDAPLCLFDQYEVRLTRTQQLEDFDLNHIEITELQTGQSHSVTHMNFKTWPDTGTPESGIPILQYIRLMHLLRDEGPVVVHCSAGIGRTGALITIDLVLKHIEKDLKFDIQKIVQDLRRQRQGMIQTKDQYKFCYKTIIDVLQTLENTTTKNLGATM